jgi:rhodanese-related sulfurtransferase
MVINLMSRAAWALMQEKADSWLVDVRTPGEWNYVGGPDLGSVGHRLIKLSWHLWPEMKINPDFIAQLNGERAPRDAHLFFLCRSGGRSLAAAQAAAEAGRPHTYNILHGFEGELDGTSRRGRLNGWKSEELPWRQT